MRQKARTLGLGSSIGIRSAGLVVVLAALSGCSGNSDESSLEIRSKTEAITLDSAAQFSLVIPSQVAVGDSAVFGSSSVKWGDRATIVAEGASGIISSADNGYIEIGHDSNVRTVVSAGNATLRDRSKVDGDLFVQGTAQIGSSAQVFGNQAVGVNVTTHEAFKMPVYLPDEAGGSVHLEPDQQLALPPADYGTVAVKSRSTVTLSTGTYDFDTLQVAEPQAKLVIDDSAGPVIIYVRNQFTYRGNVQILSIDGGFPDLLVVYLGQNELWLEAPFQGHLFAPNASAHIRPMQGTFTGSIWGKNVEVHAGTVFIHQPFDLSTFFSNIDVDNTPYIFGQSRPVVPEPDDFIIPSKVPEGNWTELPGGVPADLNCTPELTYEVDPDDPTRLLELRYLSEAEKDANAGCVGEYFECADNGDGTFGSPFKPSEEELNAEPLPGSTCEAVSQKEPCGVDDSVLELPENERTVCTTQADCGAEEVCAKYCLGVNCQPDDFVNYCTTEIESCGGLPEDGECETRSVCPEPDYTGTPYEPTPGEKAELSPEQQLSKEEPVLAAYERPACGSDPPTPVGSADESTPPQGSGNDKWGIDFSPSVDYGFTTPSTASPVTDELGVNGRAEFNVIAKVWGKKVPVLEAGVVGSLSPTSLELTRTSKLFGQQVDLTGDVVGQIKENMDLAVAAGVGAQLDVVENNLDDAQEAFSNLVWVRDVIASNDIQGNPEAGEKFCNLALSVLPNAFPADLPNEYCSPHVRCQPDLCGECDEEEPPPGEGECEIPLETPEEAAQRYEQAVQTALSAWKNEYQNEINALGDPETAMQNAVAPALNELPGANSALATNVPLESARHRFSAFRYSFTFAVGPIPITMEIELAGSWGVDAAIELSADFQDELFARAGASIIPGMDVQALAYAGINLGFASAGIGGELTLVEIEIPVKGGAEIRGQRIDDDRPLQLELPDGGIQDLSDLAGDVIPLLSTRWTGGFWYGAGMRVQILSGNVNLQARVRLLFFKKTWKKVLASWEGPEFEKSFVGSIQAAVDLELPDELEQILGEVQAAGDVLEDIPALVPLWDKGYTGHFGTQTPLLSQVAAQQLAWPPAYQAGAGVVPIPTPSEMCAQTEPGPR